jgi:hypothetical protein
MSTQTYLRWATQSDIPAITEIFALNGLNFELHAIFAPERHVQYDNFYLFLLNRIRMFWNERGFRFLVVERVEVPEVARATSKQVIGFAGWVLDDIQSTLIEHRGDIACLRYVERTLLAAERYYHRLCLNTVFDMAGFTEFLHSSHDAEDSAVPKIQLQFLFVHPQWQKSPHRVGHTLLQWGMDLSDSLQLPITLDSSLVGREFYHKHGFELFRYVRVDRVVELAYDMPVLIRNPKPRQDA